MAQNYTSTFPSPKYHSIRQPIVKRTYRKEIKTKETTVNKWPTADTKLKTTAIKLYFRIST